MLTRPSLQVLILSAALIGVSAAAQNAVAPPAAEPPVAALKIIDVKVGTGDEAVIRKAASSSTRAGYTMPPRPISGARNSIVPWIARARFRSVLSSAPVA